jgi:hypothetical protein
MYVEQSAGIVEKSLVKWFSEFFLENILEIKIKQYLCCPFALKAGSEKSWLNK